MFCSPSCQERTTPPPRRVDHWSRSTRDRRRVVEARRLLCKAPRAPDAGTRCPVRLRFRAEASCTRCADNPRPAPHRGGCCLSQYPECRVRRRSSLRAWRAELAHDHPTVEASYVLLVFPSLPGVLEHQLENVHLLTKHVRDHARLVPTHRPLEQILRGARSNEDVRIQVALVLHLEVELLQPCDDNPGHPASPNAAAKTCQSLWFGNGPGPTPM